MIVYGVYRETDMTEGRGGKALDRIYLHKEDAWRYANEHRGIMGRDSKGRHTDCPGWQCKICYKYEGDWTVREHQVLESYASLTEADKKMLREARAALVEAKALLSARSMLSVEEYDDLGQAVEILDQ